MCKIKNNYPLIMGIINLSPDSFYSESCKAPLIKIKQTDYKYADIIDIGCESSRPNSKFLDENIELNRLVQFLEKNSHLSSKFLSIDTYKPNVARFALNNGFNMINDIMSGSYDNKMMELAADFDCPIILMHMKGIPETMQRDPYYENIIDDISMFFEKKIKTAEKYGITLNNLILDPGIGFGKRIEDNDAIINNLYVFKQFGCKVLLGVSRKSFLSINGDGPSQRFSATIGATSIAIQQGVDIIRVHDIYETYKLKTVINRIISNKKATKPIAYS